MIDVVGLRVQFGAVRSIDDLTVRFSDAACGLVGPNGAGKTTLLNVLSGFVPAASGQVFVDGADILAVRPHRRVRSGLRRTFQTEQAIATLSVHDNVLAVYERLGEPRQRRRSAIADALDFVGLADRTTALAGSLNGAERRLVELARAVVGSPRAVLLDEPAAGLTEEETARLGDVIAAIPSRTGAQVVLVDHDMELVARCCTSIVVLDYGALLAQGGAAEVLRDPAVMRAYLGVDDGDGEVAAP